MYVYDVSRRAFVDLVLMFVASAWWHSGTRGAQCASQKTTGPVKTRRRADEGRNFVKLGS